MADISGPELWNGVPCSTRFTYATGHVLNDICASMWFTYLLIYFNLVLQFNPTQAGIVLLIGQVADALSTPFVGYSSDMNENFWICQYGRRKTWHLIGTICTLTTFPFIFGNCVGCENSDTWAQLIYYASFVIIFQFGWASVQISHLSLIPELTPNEHERTRLTALRFSFTVFSNILVYSIAWWSLGVDSTGDGRVSPADAPKFHRVVWIGLVVGTICAIIFHIGVREPEHPRVEYNDAARLNLHGQSPRRTIKNVFQDANLYLVACVYMSTRLFVNLSQVLLPLYLHETLKLSAQLLAAIPLCVYLSSFVTSFIVHSLNKESGRKMAFFAGVVWGIIACVWMRFGDGPAYLQYEIYGVAILIGASGSMLLVTSLGLTADFIGSDIDRGAFVYGLMSFSDKLSNGIAVIIIQHLHSTIFPESTYYRDALCYVCGGSAIFGLVAIFILRTHHLGRAHLYENLNESPIPQPQIINETIDEVGEEAINLEIDESIIENERNMENETNIENETYHDAM